MSLHSSIEVCGDNKLRGYGWIYHDPKHAAIPLRYGEEPVFEGGVDPIRLYAIWLGERALDPLFTNIALVEGVAGMAGIRSGHVRSR